MKKAFTLILAFITTATLLAGCADYGNSDTVTEAAVTAISEETTSTAATTTAATTTVTTVTEEITTPATTTEAAKTTTAAAATTTAPATTIKAATTTTAAVTTTTAKTSAATQTRLADNIISILLSKDFTINATQYGEKAYISVKGRNEYFFCDGILFLRLDGINYFYSDSIQYGAKLNDPNDSTGEDFYMSPFYTFVSSEKVTIDGVSLSAETYDIASGQLVFYFNGKQVDHIVYVRNRDKIPYYSFVIKKGCDLTVFKVPDYEFEDWTT